MAKGYSVASGVLRAGLLASCAGFAMSPAIARAQEAGGSAPTASERVASAGNGAEETDANDRELVVVARGQGTRDARVNNLQIVDAIGAKDIDSMPSQNISDVIKRLPGIQVTYDNGEAQQPNLRGVGFIQTTLDGRELVTANFRALQVGDIPADVINSVEVYKTPSANMIEGGIGGLIALKTRKPFDYSVPAATGQVSLSLDQSRNRLVPQGSIAVGGSWETGIGRIGASLGVAHTSVLLRSDFFITGYGRGTNLFDINRNGVLGETADTAIYPSFALPIQIQARHSRDSVIGSVQWSPVDELTLEGSFLHARYLDESQQYSLPVALGSVNAPPAGSPPSTTPPRNSIANAGRFTLLQDSPVSVPVVREGSYANVPFTAQSLYVRPFRSVWQQNWAATWVKDRWTIGLQGDFTQSDSNNDILIFAARGDAPNVTYTGVDSPGRGTITAPGFDITNPASFTALNYTEIIPRASSNGNSQRLDIEYRPEGFLTAFQIGFRRTSRTSTANQAFASNTVPGTLASIPGLATTSPDGDFVNADPNLFIDKIAFRRRIGLPAVLPTNAQSNFFRLRERTDAVYARALYAFSIQGVQFDGDVGIRGVRNANRGDAFAIVATGNRPIQSGGENTDWLPSATLRAKLTDTLTARFGASRTVSRPAFTQLSPGRTLNADLTGSGGNPDLQSFYANGVDVGLDWLFSPSGYATVAVFRKTLKGLVQPNIAEEVFNGLTYRINSPINGPERSSFKGVEVNLNKKFVELPGFLSGLGVDGNYTYLDSRTINTLGVRTRLPGLSTHTFNSSAYYDKGRLLMRLGYTVTSDFVNNPNFGGPIELRGEEIFGRQDVVDATIQFRINNHFRLTANAMNALQPKVGYYNGFKETPNNSYQTFRRYQFGLKFDF